MAWSDFFQPQTHLPQNLPQTADAHMQMDSLLQLLLQLRQGQVRLRLDPAAQSLLYLGRDLAPRSTPLLDPLHLSAMLALRGNLPRPRQAHREARRQLIQRALPAIMGLKQLATQIVAIRFGHRPFAAEFRQ
jgi:hypothetical protein